jgi:cation diffusion facilitator CzcD-associated flavoprotein CzcO
VEPKVLPDIPGANTFPGPIFHSARWDYSVDMNDKNVLVIGSGCSAAQFVPHLTKPPFNTKSVTQVMRSPPWVVPKLVPPGGDEWWAKNSPIIQTYVPGMLKILRFSIFCLAESTWVLFGGEKRHEEARKSLEEELLQELKATVPEKYHEILTPNYSVACKRRIFDNTWFPSLHDPKVELTTLPVTNIRGSQVSLGPGRYYPDPKDMNSKVPTERKDIPIDLIILANGFEIQNWLHPMKITGKEGKDLIETMMERGGPQAYQGTAIDSFPNFFIIFGPNTVTGHNSVIFASENMADYAMRFVKMVLRGDVRTVEVKKEAEIAYTSDIQAKLKETVFMKGGCSSWYFKDGWNSAVLP